MNRTIITFLRNITVTPVADGDYYERPCCNKICKYDIQLKSTMDIHNYVITLQYKMETYYEVAVLYN